MHPFSSPRHVARLLSSAACLMALGHASVANAAQAMVDIPIQLDVNSPTCTIANSASTVMLPAGGSSTQTWDQYMSSNAITTDAVHGGAKTSAALNQTLTVTCNTPNVPIQNVIVQPASSATLVGVCDAAANMVDASVPTPLKLAGGGAVIGYDQVSINGTSAPHFYGGAGASGCGRNPYTTAFNTGPLVAGASTATVVWRPEFSPSPNPLGQPTGGSFKTTATAVINY